MKCDAPLLLGEEYQDHRVMCAVWEGSADVKRKQGRSRKALALYRKCLTLLVQLEGEQNGSVLCVLKKVALTHKKLAEYEQAGVIYRKCLEERAFFDF